MAQSRAQHQRPRQNADVVGIGNGVYRVGHQIHQQRFQHFHNARGRGNVDAAGGHENNVGGKHKAGNHGRERGQKSADDIKHDNRLHISFVAFLMLRNRTHHQHKHQHRRHGFKRTHKQVAQEPHGHTRLRREPRQRDAEHQADDDLFDQAHTVHHMENRISACHDDSFK